MTLPPGLTDPPALWPTVFVDTGGMPLRHPTPEVREKTNAALRRALERVRPERVEGQALVKVHIGEPRCRTRMRPEFVRSTATLLRERGAAGVVAGDTTVAYTGPRGHKENPAGHPQAYLALAETHGWSVDGAAGLDFVVLDRPSSARAGVFEFGAEEIRREVSGIRRFPDFFLAGGFDAADVVVNHAHLTLHGLAGVAGCVKSLAMGCSSLQGKLRMHQYLFPYFDEDVCVRCGRCVEHCPEGALVLPEDDGPPVVDEERCIGCGECVSVCAAIVGAAKLKGQAIRDWQRGEATLNERMVDYVVGLMDGKWDRTVHVLHLVSVTALCDCVDQAQQPLLAQDLGFLVSRNPFAVDRLGAEMMSAALRNAGQAADESWRSAEAAAEYACHMYGIVPETALEHLAAT